MAVKESTTPGARVASGLKQKRGKATRSGCAKSCPNAKRGAKRNAVTARDLHKDPSAIRRIRAQLIKDGSMAKAREMAKLLGFK